MYGYGYIYAASGSGLNLTPVEIGEIFTDDFERGTLGSNYNDVGSITTTMDGSNLVLGGGAANYDNYTEYTAWGTGLENWQIVINFEATTQAAATEGIFVGIKTSSAFGNRSVIASFAHGTGGAKGKTFILGGASAPNNFNVLDTTTGQAVSAGDEIRMTITRNGLQLTCLTENITGGTNETASYTFDLLYTSSEYQHNSGYPYIGTLGGTQTIRDWNYTTTTKKYGKTLILADSLGHGVSASSVANRWANELLGASTNVWSVNSGGGDYTANVLNKIEELKLLKPQYCVLQLGGNDVRFGIAQATAEANYNSIVSQLEAVGINCIHCLAAPDNATNMTSWNTFLSSNYTTIDCFTPLKGAGTGLSATYDAGDGTHWNDAGHDLNAATILAAAPYVV